MTRRKDNFEPILFALFISACASTPAWNGMSEEEISSWKMLGMEAAAAQQWRKGCFNPDSAKTWMDSGFKYEGAQLGNREIFSRRCPRMERCWFQPERCHQQPG